MNTRTSKLEVFQIIIPGRGQCCEPYKCDMHETSQLLFVFQSTAMPFTAQFVSRFQYSLLHSTSRKKSLR